MDALVAKQVAGATMALTQLFWHADEYLEYVQRARAAGVVIPIVPGLAPITRPEQVARIAELSEHAAPADLVDALGRAEDEEAAADVPENHHLGFTAHSLPERVLADEIDTRVCGRRSLGVGTRERVRGDRGAREDDRGAGPRRSGRDAGW